MSSPSLARASASPSEVATVAISTRPGGASASVGGTSADRLTTTIGTRGTSYSSSRIVPAPTTRQCARRRRVSKTRLSASLLIVPLSPSDPVAAPSTVLTKLTRSHGSRSGV